jgi:DUF971 family protein
MAGLDANTPTPTRIVVHKLSRQLEIEFSDGKAFKISFELMRVYSPSAEVRGHGAGQEVLQVGKREVDLLTLEPVGNYALQPTFSDGHTTGIFSWDYLHWLGSKQEDLWSDYLQRVREAGATRESGATAPPPSASKSNPPALPKASQELQAQALRRPKS